jgi:hypothetical protein
VLSARPDAGILAASRPLHGWAKGGSLGRHAGKAPTFSCLSLICPLLSPFWLPLGRPVEAGQDGSWARAGGLDCAREKKGPDQLHLSVLARGSPRTKRC